MTREMFAKYTDPETFEKIVKTFRDKYDIEFVFCKPNECAKKIIELLLKK